MKKGSKIAIVFLVSLIGGCGLIYRNEIQLFLELFNNPFNDKKFDQQVWLVNANITESNNPRGQMVTDLEENYIWIGMTKKEVYDLLGEPYPGTTKSMIDSSAYGPGRPNLQVDTLMLYPIGWYSGFGIDPDFFAVKLNGKGVVMDFWIEQH